jgi:hypothetical protein
VHRGQTSDVGLSPCKIEIDPEGREFYEEAAAAAASLAVCIDIFAVAEEVRHKTSSTDYIDMYWCKTSLLDC